MTPEYCIYWDNYFFGIIFSKNLTIKINLLIKNFIIKYPSLMNKYSNGGLIKIISFIIFK